MRIKPTDADRAAMLTHLRCEMEHCFSVPLAEQKNWNLKESVFLAILIHARILIEFFEAKDGRKDDVLCADFGFPPTNLPISVDERRRFARDFSRLSYARLRHPADPKPCPIFEVLRPLRERAIEFIAHVTAQPPKGANGQELETWRALLQMLKTCDA